MRTRSLRPLSDATVARGLDEVVTRENASTALVLAYVAEFDFRKLYLPAGYSSTFEYCVVRLHLSEDAAYKRIRAGRAARRFPFIIDALEAGRLHLTGIVFLAPHLTQDNAAELIEAATHKTKAEIEQLLANRFPKPDVPARVVALAPRSETAETGDPVIELVPEPVSLSVAEHDAANNSAVTAPRPEPTPQVEASIPRPIVKPLAPERYAIQFTANQETYDKLRHVQALLSHRVASGDLAQVFARALDALSRELEKDKFAATESPRPSSHQSADPRQVPAHVKRAVWERDGGRCTYVSAEGHRCTSRKFLEYDHIDLVARGGRATVSRMRLRCRAHNQYEAECALGLEFMNGKREEARRVRLRSG